MTKNEVRLAWATCALKQPKVQRLLVQRLLDRLNDERYIPFREAWDTSGDLETALQFFPER